MSKIQKTKVAVVLTKTLYLSKGCLTRSNLVGDAIFLAQKDFVDEVNDKSENINNLAQKGFTLLTSLFDVKVIDSPKYIIPIDKQKKHSPKNYRDFNSKNINIGEAVRLIINHNLELRYGVLDPEKNPKIYKIVPEVKDENNNILVQGYHTLTEEVQEQFYNLRDTYLNLLDVRENNIKNVEFEKRSLGEFLLNDEDEIGLDEDDFFNEDEDLEDDELDEE